MFLLRNGLFEVDVLAPEQSITLANHLRDEIARYVPGATIVFLTSTRTTEGRFVFDESELKLAVELGQRGKPVIVLGQFKPHWPQVADNRLFVGLNGMPNVALVHQAAGKEGVARAYQQIVEREKPQDSLAIALLSDRPLAGLSFSGIFIHDNCLYVSTETINRWSARRVDELAANGPLVTFVMDGYEVIHLRHHHLPYKAVPIRILAGTNLGTFVSKSLTEEILWQKYQIRAREILSYL